jgi:ribA/ribD-fused uncharacterized protein
MDYIKQFQGEYRWLSNFWPVTISYGEPAKFYPSVEHAYMSAKSDDPEWKSFCSDFSNPAGYVKKASRNIQLVANWEEIKFNVMKELLDQKFEVPYLREALIATGRCYIQEGNNWGDKVWGVCLKTGEGQNALGKMIMVIRNNLK